MKILLPLLATLLLAATSPLHADSPADLPDGYYFLHETLHQESEVTLLLLIKTTPPSVAAYLKRISAQANASLDTLDRLAAGDSSLVTHTDPLPPFESAVRASIKADKQHTLLFGSKGDAFALHLLFAQIEGTNYISHLAKVWAERDPDADRDATMRHMSARWLALREEGFRLLAQMR